MTRSTYPDTCNKNSSISASFFLSVEDLLVSQGFSWNETVKSSGLLIQGQQAKDPKSLVLVQDGLEFNVCGETHKFAENVYVALHKPAGYECSRQPQSGRSIFDLLPAHFHSRGLQPAGRLDVGTSGLLLLSDDARFLHHASHPSSDGTPLLKHYRAECAAPVTVEQLAALTAGVRLKPLGGGAREQRVRYCTHVRQEGPRTLCLAISEGSFHQARPPS
jgi:16S rRNA pseudouridine516 synthase